MSNEQIRHFDTIVDEAPVGILSYDYDENILVANQQICYYLGKKQAEVIGKNAKVVLSEFNPEILITIDVVKNRDTAYREFLPANVKNKTYYFNVKGVVLPEQGLLIFENVTSIKIHQDDLKKLDKSKDEFISIASHDLRTPIAAIRGYLDMVLKEEVGVISTPKMKEYLTLAREGSLRLSDLVEDILSVSRIEQRTLRYELENIDFEPLIQTILREETPKAKARNLYLKYENAAKKLPKLQIDKNRFQEIISNLISNAIKFTSEGGIILKVTPRDSHVRFDCIDTGIGISKEDQKKVFIKFNQLDSSTSSQDEGTGLGLYISKMMVEEMGGRIGVTSAPGKGADFFFTIPIVDSLEAKKAIIDIQEKALASIKEK